MTLMRWPIVCCVGVLLWAGCRSRSGDTSPPRQAAAVTGESGQTATLSPPNAPEEPVIIPVTPSTGVVARVHPPLRFVVLDYALTHLPGIDQILFLYRKGQRVAKVKVTGPVRGQTVAADILEGVAVEGDEVRAE